MSEFPRRRSWGWSQAVEVDQRGEHTLAVTEGPVPSRDGNKCTWESAASWVGGCRREAAAAGAPVGLERGRHWRCGRLLEQVGRYWRAACGPPRAPQDAGPQDAPLPSSLPRPKAHGRRTTVQSAVYHSWLRFCHRALCSSRRRSPRAKSRLPEEGWGRLAEGGREGGGPRNSRSGRPPCRAAGRR